MTLFFIVGRTPQLAFREIEAVAQTLPFKWRSNKQNAGFILAAERENEMQEWLDSSPQELVKLQNRLGGTLKIVQLLRQVGKNSLVEEMAQLVIQKQKRDFGISIYGKEMPVQKLGLQVKRLIKEQGGAGRFIAPKEGGALSTAQVWQQHLAALLEGKGVEVVAVADKNEFWLGYTLTVQNIDSYSKRDFGIPFPDPVSGMLSPKLAQTMVNLALEGQKLEVCDIVDPFCGNGRILGEALLMGCTVYGGDISNEKVAAARANIQWLAKEYDLSLTSEPADFISQSDATKPLPPKPVYELMREQVVFRPWYIVSEPFLGRPLRQPLKESEKEAWLKELSTLYLAFFKVWADFKEDLRRRPKSFVMVFPSAKTQSGQAANLFLNLVDRIEEMGYSAPKVSTYGRPDALIDRDIVQVRYK